MVLFDEKATMSRAFLDKPFRWLFAGDLLRHRSHDKNDLSFQSFPCISSRKQAIAAYAINGS